jgi:hypothetical protein
LAGVKAFNHFHAGAGVASQRQQVNVPTVEQAQRNGGMAQVVKSACWDADSFVCLARFSNLHVAMQSN